MTYVYEVIRIFPQRTPGRVGGLAQRYLCKEDAKTDKRKMNAFVKFVLFMYEVIRIFPQRTPGRVRGFAQKHFCGGDAKQKETDN